MAKNTTIIKYNREPFNIIDFYLIINQLQFCINYFSSHRNALLDYWRYFQVIQVLAIRCFYM